MPFDPSMFTDIEDAYKSACSDNPTAHIVEEKKVVEVSNAEMTML